MSAFKIHKRTVELVEIDTQQARDQFAKIIVTARKKKGLTQEDLSAALNIGRAQIANLETGRSWVGIEQFLKLVFILDLTISKDTFK